MIDELRVLYLRELAACGRELDLFPSDEAVWATLPGVSNSAGNLVLHLCGNLRHFIGAQLGATGYLRNREAEFTRHGEPRSVLRAELAAATRDVSETLDLLTPAVLAAPYPSRLPPADIATSTGQFLMHLASHLAYHLGQIDYLRRIANADSRTAGTLPLAALATPAEPRP